MSAPGRTIMPLSALTLAAILSATCAAQARNGRANRFMLRGPTLAVPIGRPQVHPFVPPQPLVLPAKAPDVPGRTGATRERDLKANPAPMPDFANPLHRHRMAMLDR